MKRILASLLIVGTVFCCSACGDQSSPSLPDSPPLSVPESPLVQGIIAATIGNHKLSRTELNYFYIDSINEYCNQYSQYLSYFLDTSKPLDEQLYDDESSKTWADAFLDMAIDSAKNTYALYDAAVAAGHKLSSEEQEAVNELYDSMEPTAQDLGYSSANAYLKAYYGSGASVATYKEYYEVTAIASSYYTKYIADLKDSYTNDDLRQYEAGMEHQYNSYNYLSHYLSVEDFEGTEISILEAATELAVESNNTEDKLNKAIEKLEQRLSGSEYSTCTKHENVHYNKLNVAMQEWLGSSDRQPGDITYLESASVSLDESGNEVKTLKGCYIVVYQGINDNTFLLPNVRHILIPFEGGLTDEYGGVTYSEAEKLAAHNQAQELLQQWKDGDQSEASFAALAEEHSTDPGPNTNGGLYTEIVPGQMVTAFNDWCFDPDRESMDTGIIETEYGVHVMFYSGLSDLTYRNYLVTSDKLQEDVDAWQTALNDAVLVKVLDTGGIETDLILDVPE